MYIFEVNAALEPRHQKQNVRRRIAPSLCNNENLMIAQSGQSAAGRNCPFFAGKK
jgi:hypothetical protein